MNTLLTYQEYKEFGGNVDENTFNYLYPESASKLNYFTFGRVGKLIDAPYEVKVVLVRFINYFSKNDTDRDKTITGYSNGIESFQYNNISGIYRDNDKYLYSLCVQFLTNYPELINRGMKV